MFSKEQKERLLAIARETMETYIRQQRTPEFEENDPELSKPYGAFVHFGKEKLSGDA